MGGDITVSDMIVSIRVISFSNLNLTKTSANSFVSKIKL